MLGLNHHHQAHGTVHDILDRSLAGDTVSAAPVEQYRALALTLESAEPRRPHRSLVVTSALPGEGKTLTVTNLAYTLSRSYRRRVLLVDGDLRRPRLHGVLSSRGTPAAQLPAQDVPPMATSLGFQTTRLSPTLLLVGSPHAQEIDAVKTLNSPEMQALLEWAKSRFDWVLVDSPPVALVPDATILSQLSDAVLFVVLTGKTPSALAKRAVATLGRERVIGVVMNQVPASTSDGALGYYEEYRAHYEASPASASR